MALLSVCVSLALLLLACTGPAHSQDMAALREGVWDVNSLVPGRGAVPPFHELHIEAGQWTLRERPSSRVSRLLDSAGARLGITYAAIPRDETSLCHSTPQLRWELTALRTDDGFALECSTESWLTAAVLRTFAREGFVSLRFENPQPLSLKVNGVCTETPWRVDNVAFTKVSEESVIVSGVLLDGSSDVLTPCKAYFELTRRPTALAKDASSSSTSAYAPVALLLVVIAVRLLPRYILTRTGQIDQSSYRGRNPASLTAERRAELLRKQRRIIDQMKAEDRANAPKEKTS